MYVLYKDSSHSVDYLGDEKFALSLLFGDKYRKKLKNWGILVHQYGKIHTPVEIALFETTL